MFVSGRERREMEEPHTYWRRKPQIIIWLEMCVFVRFGFSCGSSPHQCTVTLKIEI